MRTRASEASRLRTGGPARKVGRLALVLFLTLSGTVLVAGVLTGGLFQIYKSLSSSGGGNANVTGGTFALAHSFGQPNAAVMSGGAFTLESGYHTESGAASLLPPAVSSTTIPELYVNGGLPLGVSTGAVLTVSFTSPMNPATLNGASVTLVGTRDNIAGGIDVSVTATLSYDPATQILSVTPNGPLATNTFYTLQVSTAAFGAGGAPLAAAVSEAFLTTFDHTLPNVFPDAVPGVAITTELTAPAGIFPANGYIVIKDDPVHYPDPQNPDKNTIVAQILEANTQIVASGGPFMNPVLFREVSAYDLNNNRIQLSSANVASLTVTYQADSHGIIVGSEPPVHAANTSLYVLDETRNVWVRLPSIHDLEKHTVTAALPHISVFALIAGDDTDVSQVYAYPVPWKPRSASSAQYGTLAQGITFTNMPSMGTLKIYTLSGKLVNEIDFNSGAATLQWLGTNSSGAEVASGVYLWEVTSSGNHKTGKLMVVW